MVTFVGPDTDMVRDPHWDDDWTDKFTNEYVLPHPDNPLIELRAGRASELGKTISNTFTLNQWHQRMVVQGMATQHSLLMRAIEVLSDGLTPKERRKALQEIASEAKVVAGGKEPASLGTGMHKLTELYDQGKITLDQVPEPWSRDIMAYAMMLRKMGIVHVPEFTEKIIWVRSLNVAGRFDRLVRYRHCDRWHVEDLKTGRNLQYGWGEIPIQLQVYSLADYLFDPISREWMGAPEICRDVGLVHHVPVGGPVDEAGEAVGFSESVLYEVDLTTVIKTPSQWMNPADLCIAIQKWRGTRRLARPVARVRVTGDGEVEDVPLSIMERLDLATSERELYDIRAEFSPKHWMPWHTRKFNERVSALSS